MSEVRFRRGAAADVPAMYALDRVCFAEPFRFSLQAMRRFALAPEAWLWVAEAGAQMAGFVIVEVQEQSAYVVTLDVAPASRRGGVATALVRLAYGTALDEGAEQMILHVHAGNAAAIRFYEGERFERHGSDPEFYGPGIPAFVYRRGL